MKIRIISILLAMLAIMPLAGCSAEEKTSGESIKQDSAADSDVVVSESTQSEDTVPLDSYGRPIIEDTVPDDLDFEGTNLSFISTTEYLYDGYIDELNGEMINDMLYTRWHDTGEELNVSFTSELTDYKGFVEPVKKSVLAGDDVYDCALIYPYDGLPLTSYGCYMNLNDVPYIDMEQVWWDDSYVEEMTYNGKLFTLTGDFCLSDLTFVPVIFFNRSLASEWLPDTDLYQMVYDHEWNCDNFGSLLKDTYSDLNGDSVRDSDDFYGMIVPAPDALMLAVDVTVTEKTDNGFKISLLNEKMVNSFGSLIDMLYKTGGILKLEQTGENNAKARSNYIAGKSVFISDFYKNVEEYRDMEDDFGVLPDLMVDETDDYKCSNLCINHLLTVVSTSQKTEALGAAIEKMASYSYREITPAFFEVVMKYKYNRSSGEDTRDFDMFDIIRDCSTYNFGFVYNNCLNPGVLQLLRKIINDNLDYVSTVTKNESTLNASLEKLLKGMDEIG